MTPRSIFFFWKLRQPVVDMFNSYVYLYLCNYSGLWEEKYTQFIKSSIKSCNCYPMQKKNIFGDKEDQIIWYFILVFIQIMQNNLCPARLSGRKLITGRASLECSHNYIYFCFCFRQSLMYRKHPGWHNYCHSFILV